MHTPPQGMRLCPTRIDTVETLVAHTITQSMCQTRQREHYHKCGTCEHNNARVAERDRGVPLNRGAVDLTREAV